MQSSKLNRSTGRIEGERVKGMGNESFKLSKHIEEAFYGVVGTSDCHKVGIMGGCGLECFVYQESRCHIPDEIKIYHVETEEDESEHERLYGNGPQAIESSAITQRSDSRKEGLDLSHE